MDLTDYVSESSPADCKRVQASSLCFGIPDASFKALAVKLASQCLKFMPRICGVWTSFLDVGPYPLIGVRSPVNIHLTCFFLTQGPFWIHILVYAIICPWPGESNFKSSDAQLEDDMSSKHEHICPWRSGPCGLLPRTCSGHLSMSAAMPSMTWQPRPELISILLTEMIHAQKDPYCETSPNLIESESYFLKKNIPHTWLLRLGFMLAIRLVLRLRPRGLLSLGPPCGSFVWVNLATSLRTLSEPYGDVTKSHVSLGNLLLNWN